MAGITNSDKIAELQRLVATLVERVDAVRNEMPNRDRLVVIEERLNEFKRTYEDIGHKHWSMWTAIIGGIVGAGLMLLGQLAINLLKKGSVSP